MIPLDGSRLAERVLEPVFALDTGIQTEYTLLRVVIPMALNYGSTAGAYTGLSDALKQMQELDHAEWKGAQAYLEGLAQRFVARSLTVQTRVIENDRPARAILGDATVHGADLIALATRGRGGVKRLVLGSVADKVLRGADTGISAGRRLGPYATMTKCAQLAHKARLEQAPKCRSASSRDVRLPGRRWVSDRFVLPSTRLASICSTDSKSNTMRRIGMTWSQQTWFLAVAIALLLSAPTALRADDAGLEAEVRQRASAVEEKVINWRRDIHDHPELADQETRTSRLVAEHLRSLGLEVRTGVARTGFIGVLKGGKPGRTVALRADMDALPVKEPEGLPFASKAKQPYLGKEVDVMHACGHDAHTAMLMGVAEVLVEIKDKLPGTVLFMFQPAEEGPSLFTPASGKTWGAKLMLEEGAFKDPKPDGVLGLHVMPGPSGQISYRTGATAATAASSDDLEITVTGRQGHGGMP